MLSNVPKEKYQDSEDLMLPLRGSGWRNDYEHKPLHWFVDNMIIPPNLPIIAICRNPYKRAISVYFHLIRNKIQKAERRKIFNGVVPSDIIREYENTSFVDFLKGNAHSMKEYPIYPNSDITFNDIIELRNWDWLNTQESYIKNVDFSKLKIFKIEEPEKINDFFDIDINSWNGELTKVSIYKIKKYGEHFTAVKPNN